MPPSSRMLLQSAARRSCGGRPAGRRYPPTRSPPLRSRGSDCPTGSRRPMRRSVDSLNGSGGAAPTAASAARQFASRTAAIDSLVECLVADVRQSGRDRAAAQEQLVTAGERIACVNTPRNVRPSPQPGRRGARRKPPDQVVSPVGQRVIDVSHRALEAEDFTTGQIQSGEISGIASSVYTSSVSKRIRRRFEPTGRAPMSSTPAAEQESGSNAAVSRRCS